MSGSSSVLSVECDPSDAVVFAGDFRTACSVGLTVRNRSSVAARFRVKTDRPGRHTSAPVEGVVPARSSSAVVLTTLPFKFRNGKARPASSFLLVAFADSKENADRAEREEWSSIPKEQMQVGRIRCLFDYNDGGTDANPTVAADATRSAKPKSKKPLRRSVSSLSVTSTNLLTTTPPKSDGLLSPSASSAPGSRRGSASRVVPAEEGSSSSSDVGIVINFDGKGKSTPRKRSILKQTKTTRDGASDRVVTSVAVPKIEAESAKVPSSFSAAAPDPMQDSPSTSGHSSTWTELTPGDLRLLSLGMGMLAAFLIVFEAASYFYY